MTTISKLAVLASFVLAASVSICHAAPRGGATAGKGGKTVQKCQWVTTTVPVSDGHDKYGFPINLRMVTTQIYVCRDTKA